MEFLWGIAIAKQCGVARLSERKAAKTGEEAG
jgi:hypothetical protein